MESRKRKLSVLSILACLMLVWTIGSAMGCFLLRGRANSADGNELFTPAALGILGCASLTILMVILYFIRTILCETLPSADGQ